MEQGTKVFTVADELNILSSSKNKRFIGKVIVEETTEMRFHTKITTSIRNIKTTEIYDTNKEVNEAFQRWLPEGVYNEISLPFDPKGPSIEEQLEMLEESQNA